MRTIIDMVQGNRFYCCASSTAMMRQGLVQAMHHATYRSAFRRKLMDQPLMRNVFTDLAIEVEAALVLTLRLARALDEAESDASAAVLALIGTALDKYWICKRAPGHVFEALECHGGPGYIEDSIMPRLYREAPVNSIWEGSGNVICLDVQRAMFREEGAIPSFLAELDAAQGANPNLDASIEACRREIENPRDIELRARDITERMAATFQGALLVLHAPGSVSDAFCASRLGDRWTGTYGALPPDVDFDSIIERTLPFS